MPDGRILLTNLDHSYNSVIFTTQSAIDYPAILVTKEFLTNGTWEPTAKIMPHCDDWKKDAIGLHAPHTGQAYGLELCTYQEYSSNPPNVAQLQVLQQNATALERLENADCINAFASNFQHTYRSALLVSDASNENNSVVDFLGSNNIPWAHGNNGSWSYDSYSWMCKEWRSPPYDHPGASETWACNTGELVSEAVNWQLYNDSISHSVPVTVDHCLVEFAMHSPCSVLMSRELMIVVIIFNVFKLTCFAIAFMLLEKPLITIGDAIESFLQSPELTTHGFGPLSLFDIRKRAMWRFKAAPKLGLSSNYEPVPQPSQSSPVQWSPRHSRWLWAASPRRWILVMILCTSLWVVSFALLTTNTIGHSLPSLAKLGSGSINKEWFITSLTSQSLSGNALVVNSPQLLLSFTYISYNGILTSMVLTSETTRLSTHRKTLRVSSPRGAQRSTPWLSLPYRYAIPLILAMALLHWLASQSIFLARINVLDYNYNIQPKYTYNGIGWSPIALICALILGSVMIVTLLVLGIVKKYPKSMPLMASNSAAIAASCHRAEYERGSDITTVPLMYGVFKDTGLGGNRRVGFSAEEIEGLKDGEIYA